MENITCKNCENSFKGNYCNICGQKVYTEKFKLKKEISTVLGNVFSLDKGIILTVKLLTIKPGLLIKDYLSGATKKYTHPIKFLMLCVTISVVIIHLTGIYETTTGQFNEIVGYNKEQLRLQNMIMPILKKYVDVIILIMIPFQSLFSYLFYKKHKLNYTEHLLLNSFLFGYISLLGIVLMPINFLLPKFIIGLLVWAIYYTYCFKSLFKTKVIKSFFLSVSMVISSYFAFGVMAIILSITLGIILSFLGVDIKELLT